MSLTVGAEDKTKTVSCYANNLALSETKVLIFIVTISEKMYRVTQKKMYHKDSDLKSVLEVRFYFSTW